MAPTSPPRSTSLRRIGWHHLSAPSLGTISRGHHLSYENDGDGANWTLHTVSLTADLATSVFAADVDGDGDTDALSASFFENKVAWYENNGDGTSWTVHAVSLGALGAWSTVAADVDGDGDVDVLSASRNDDKIAWYPNLGRGVFDDGFDSDANNACWSSAVP